MVPGVTVDLESVILMLNSIGFTYMFALIWGVPFDNFDPINNYTITIGCNGSGCPVILTTDNATNTLNVSYATRTTNITIMITAMNSVGTSYPASLDVNSKYVVRR